MRGAGVPREAAAEGILQVGFGEPEVALRVEVAVDGADLFARVGQQFEGADQHAVVAQQVLVADALAQRHHLVAIVARHACAAPVEQRNLDIDAVAVLAGFAGLGVMEVRDVGHEDEARGAGQAERAGEDLELQLRGLQVEAVADGVAFEVAHFRPGAGQVGQALRQPVLCAGAPQSELARERLAGGDGALAGGLRGGIGVEGLFVGVVERADVAGAGEIAGKEGAGLGRVADLLGITGRLLGGDGFHPSAAGRLRLPQHGVGGGQPGLREAAGLDARRDRQRQQLYQADRDSQESLEAGAMDAPRVSAARCRRASGGKREEAGEALGAGRRAYVVGPVQRQRRQRGRQCGAERANATGRAGAVLAVVGGIGRVGASVLRRVRVGLLGHVRAMVMARLLQRGFHFRLDGGVALGHRHACDGRRRARAAHCHDRCRRALEGQREQDGGQQEAARQAGHGLGL